MRPFRYCVLTETIPYTGRELRSGWVECASGMDGDAAAGFIGPCRVETGDLVDLDDARSGLYIEAREMAHVLIEHPGCELETTVWRQRMLVTLLGEILGESGVETRRDGDDLYVNSRKLTVSIAAPSPRSCLIHLGINVDPIGAPVPAVGLTELGVAAGELVGALLGRYADELASAIHATRKVKTVE